MKLTGVTHGNQELERYLSGLESEIGVGFGGNVYYVIQSSKAFYQDFVDKHQKQYSDGSFAVYSDSGNGLGIQAAINACKGGRGDYIIVGTGSYQLTVALTFAGKS